MTHFHILKGKNAHGSRIFPDDFYEIQKFFEQNETENNTNFLSVSPTDPRLEDISSQLSPVSVQPSQLSGYRIDGGPSLNEAKRGLHFLAAHTVGQNLLNNQLTLVPSVTHGIWTVLCLAKQYNFRRVIFEAPVYYAALHLAALLGFDIIIYCRSESENFEIDSSDVEKMNEYYDHYVLILTHPKFGPCINRDVSRTHGIYATLPYNSWLILDEAADRELPSRLNFPTEDERLFRIKGVFKGFALNGVRAAYIIHNARHRHDLLGLLNVTSAQIDSFTSQLLLELPERFSEFKALVSVAEQRVRQNFESISFYLYNTGFSPKVINNGYFGLLRLKLDPNSAFEHARDNILWAATASGIKMQFGSSLYLPYEPGFEYIRLNYFIDEYEMIRMCRRLQNLDRLLQNDVTNSHN